MSLKDKISAPLFFVAVGFTLCGLAVLTLLLPFTTAFGKDIALNWAQAWNPGIDAPDNWAVGFTYMMRTSAVVFVTGSVSLVFGIVVKGTRAT